MSASTKRPRRGGSNLVTAVVVAGAVLVLGAGGGAVAATQIGSSQIADNSIQSRDVRDGGLWLRDLSAATRAALQGSVGPQGETGPPGAPGEDGTDGVNTIVALVGPVQSIVGNSGNYVFAGPPAQVTITSTARRVTGSASAPLGLNTGSTQSADVGLCYQPSGGGSVTNFYGGNFAQNSFTTTRTTYAVAATMILSPGVFNVGMCVRNNGSSTINNNNYINGWVMVTS